MESRHDATRSGRTTDPGPAFNETAFVVHLDGPRALASTPIILNGHVYALTQNLGAYGQHGYNSTGRNALWQVNTSTGVPEAVFEYEMTRHPDNWPTVVSDGRFVYVVTRGRVDAFDPATGNTSKIWERAPLSAQPDWGWVCNPPTIQSGVLYLGCIEINGGYDEQGGANTPLYVMSFLAAIQLNGAEAAQEKWSRIIPPTRPHGAQEPLQVPAETDPCSQLPRIENADSESGCPSFPILLGHSVLEDLVITATATGAPVDEFSPGAAGSTNEAVIADGALAAFDKETGALAWTRHHPTVETAQDHAGTATQPQYRVWDRVLKVEVTGTEGQIFSREPELVWLKASDGTRIGESEKISEGDFTKTAQAPGFALDGETLYASSEQYIHRYAWRDRLAVGRSERQLDESEFFMLPDMVATDDTLWAKSTTLRPTASGGWGRFHSESNHLIAYDTSGSRLTERWRVDFNGGYSPNILWLAFGVGDGIIAAHGLDGNLTIIGHTAASIDVRPMVSDAWPTIGAVVRVDLSGSAPGSDGAPSRFRIDWGDGYATPWQRDPVFEYRYEEGGKRTLQAWAANEAGQMSVATTSLGVGLTEPGSENLVSRAFAPENQEVTFFVLGLIVTLLGALFGLLRLRRRRTLLRRELDAVTHGIAALKGDPEGAERFLRKQRLHAETLFTNGKLTGADHGVLLSHIQHTQSEVRLADLSGPLSFLPYRLVQAIRDTMKDGRLLPNEHERLVALVERDPWLSKDQKRTVRIRLDDWMAKDA